MYIICDIVKIYVHLERLKRISYDYYKFLKQVITISGQYFASKSNFYKLVLKETCSEGIDRVRLQLIFINLKF